MITEFLRNEILDSIDNIDDITMESEMNIISAMLGSCEKAITILENYEGDDLSSFNIFQEGYYLEADDSTNENAKADGTYDNADGSKTVVKNGKEYNSETGLRRAKKDGSGVESIFKTIIAVIPRLFKMLYNKIKQGLSNKNNINESINTITSAEEDKANMVSKAFDVIKEVWTSDGDKNTLKNKLLSIGIPGAMVGVIVTLAAEYDNLKKAIKNFIAKHKDFFKMSDKQLEKYKENNYIDSLEFDLSFNKKGYAVIPLNLSNMNTFIANSNDIFEDIADLFKDGSLFVNEKMSTNAGQKISYVKQKIMKLKSLFPFGSYKVTKDEIISYNNKWVEDNKKWADDLSKAITTIENGIENYRRNNTKDGKLPKDLGTMKALQSISNELNILSSFSMEMVSLMDHFKRCVENYAKALIYTPKSEQPKDEKSKKKKSENKKESNDTNSEETTNVDDNSSSSDTQDSTTTESWYQYSE